VPLLLKLGVDRITASDSNLAWPIGGILTLTVLRYGLLSFGRRQNALISVDLAAALRLAVFSHLQKQGADFFSRYVLGDLMTRATNDVEAIRQFFRGAVHQLVSISAVIIIAPIFMLLQSPLLTLLVIGLLGALAAASVFLAAAIRRQSVKAQAQFAALTDEIQRNLYGVRTIQAHVQEDHEIQRFAQSSDDYAFSNIALIRFQALLGSFLIVSANTIAVVVAGIGGAQVLRGDLSLGTLTAFIFYAGMVLGALSNCGGPTFLFLRASTACARLFEILDEKPEIDDLGSPASARICGAITIGNVTFRYPRGSLALKNMSLEIASGELVVILGRIGSGKTTLLRLLARQLEPMEGTILIDGADIRSLPLNQLRREVAFVTQDAFVFAASFGENISYDQPDRADELIWGAAHAASLTEMIRRWPLGLATLIGERGVTLSGGQKQRTVLARGLIRKTPVLLLDDCFSALDAETEARINRSGACGAASQPLWFLTGSRRRNMPTESMYWMKAAPPNAAPMTNFAKLVDDMLN